MDKTIVIYKSKYGASKQYAQWIAEELECPAVSIDEVKKSDLKNYDNILYGGGVQAGGIKELDKFMKWIKSDLKLLDMYRSGKITAEDLKSSGVCEKHIVIFAVGINLENAEARKQLRDINFPKNYMKTLSCYFLPGEYHPEQIQGADKMLMGMVRKMLMKKKNAETTEDDKRIMEYLEKGCNLIDRSRIRPIIEEIKSTKQKI